MPVSPFPFEVPSVIPVRPRLYDDRCSGAVARARVMVRLIALALALGLWLGGSLSVDVMAQTQTIALITSSVAWDSGGVFHNPITWVPDNSMSQTQTLSSSASSTPDPVTISGQVINSASGTPIPRALVRMNGTNNRAMLTDHEGKFRFEQLTGLQFSQTTSTFVNLQVTKPGYYQSSDPMDAGNQTYPVDQSNTPLVVRLYPEALITGTVIGPDGEPLPHISVVARRSSFDESGHRWLQVGQGQTDQHGDFRLTVPAGDYKIETRYVPRNGGGSEAVMPVTIPSGGAGGAQVVHLRSGEEQHFDMHPGVRKTYAVPVSIEGAGDRGFPSVTARASDGSSFNVGVAPNRGPGHATISLPIGTYTLSARNQNQEGMQVAETRVTVTGAGSEAETAGVALRFVEIPAIPVDLSIDPSATSDNTSGSSGNYQPNGSQTTVRSGSSTQLPTFGLGSQSMPTPQQFGLTLQRVDQDEDDGMTNFGIQQRREGTASFMAPPGTYRLTARGQGRWYILSASFGTSDLSRENLVVAAGASSATIHLVVTNQTGSLQGTVKLNGQPVSSWISLISTTPSLTPVISLRTNSGGTFSNPYVPPGTYQAIAFEHRHAVDFTDPETLKAYSIYLQTVTITPGNQSTLNLNAVPQTEVTP